jgi:hypothetical protein
MRGSLENLPARCIDAVRIHRVIFETRDGLEGVLKQRRPGMGAMIWCGNWFLRGSKSGIEMFSSVRDWQRNEARAFALCHPDCCVRPVGRNALFFERLPGRSLRELARDSDLSELALDCAARELRRTHALIDPRTSALWSHGDPHLANFLFDVEGGRCWLIDFETAHLDSCSVVWRHADDLLVFCLELLGRGSATTAISQASAFVRSYDRAEITRQLLSRLDVPGGLGRVLWETRTEYLPGPELRVRVEALRKELQ